MPDHKPTVVVTGISGDLGLRLLSQLQMCDVVGVDLAPPRAEQPLRFVTMDLGRESSCRSLVQLLHETHASAVVHLAFVQDPLRAGISEPRRMWQVNVAGTARVMEAITEVNRSGGNVTRFVFTSSAHVYGSDLSAPAVESSILAPGSLPCAVHQREADEVVQYRASTLGECDTFLLRVQTHAGAGVHNYMLDAFRGLPASYTPNGKRPKRASMFIPFDRRYQENQLQFVHVDDVASLIGHILEHGRATDGQITTLNVAGRDGSLPFETCAEIAGTKIVHLPGRPLCRMARGLFGNSSIKPEAIPYVFGSWPTDTTRLRTFLGSDYAKVIRHTVREAFADSFTQVHHDTAENTTEGETAYLSR